MAPASARARRDTMLEYLQASNGAIPADLRQVVETIARSGGTPLVVVAQSAEHALCLLAVIQT